MADDDLLTERLLRVIDEGRRTATYKLALLLAVLDLAASGPDADDVATRAIAERVVELYYPQVRGYVATDGLRELRQISMKSSAAVTAVLRLRAVGDAAGCRTVHEVRRRLPDEWARCVAVVEDTFVRYPIPLLQVVGSQRLPFLYEDDWREGASVAALRRRGEDRVRLLPGVRARLVALGPLLRPLIELHWTRDVARWSKLATEDDRLHAHLFGTSRLAFPPSVRSGLADLQGGRCFYCGRPITGPSQVDHFLAWSRWPNDAIENLVLADRCNGDKRDHLAAEEHVDRWVARGRDHGDDLEAIAASGRWITDAARTFAFVRSSYRAVVAGVPLWVRIGEVTLADGPIEISPRG